jgi:excisionase family DNA binding protein
VFLARSRNPDSGIYHHPSEPKDPAPAEVDRYLRQAHEEIFAKWLTFRREEQRADLELYFSDLHCGNALAVQTWLNLESYRWLIPASADPIERQLFLSELEAVLRLMAHDLSTALGGFEILPPVQKKFLTARELSGYLGISYRSVCLWAERKKMPATKVGHQWRFLLADVAHWIRANRPRGDWVALIAWPEGQKRTASSGVSASTGSAVCAISCSGVGIFALTARERDVFDLIAHGKTNKEISASLSISENTVREHRKRICAKLDVHSSAELITCAVCRFAGMCRQATPGDDGIPR